MIDSKLVNILKTFSRSELGRWRDFAKSPYFNKNRHVITLAHFLEKRYPSFNPKTMTKETAFAVLFPRKKYDDLRLRHLMSVLLKVTEEFLVSQNVKQNKVSKNIKLAETFSTRNLTRHFKSGSRQLAELQKSRDRPDVFYHYHQYKIEMQHEQFLDRQQGRRKTTGLQKVSDHLDAFYLINKLKQCCAMISHRNVFGQQYELKMMNEILQHLNTHRYDIPLLELYHTGLHTLLEPENEVHFFRLKENLEKHTGTISKEESSELHVIARNYSIRRLNTGDRKYARELFELYKLGLESKVLLDDAGKMTPASFKNIIAVGLNLKEFDWTENFIRDYSALMEEQYQKDYLNYNLAKLYFEKKDYNKVTDMLRETEYMDIFIAGDARALLIKTYYEIDEYDLLVSLLDSFRQFIQRRKELSYHGKNYLNLIRYIRSLIRLKPYDKQELEKLRQKIAGEQMLTEKAWLIEKIDQL